MALRRGFKSEANAIAREVRAELSLQPYDPLDPWQLADSLGIEVVPLSSYRDSAPHAVRHFGREDSGAFSALTVFSGPSRLIVHNDRHSRGRQSANLAHELAHALLQHQPHAALDAHGCRVWLGDYEEEAEWLTGALLVSDEAAITIVRRGLSEEVAAEQYGVSRLMMRYRLNVTGAKRRVARYGRR